MFPLKNDHQKKERTITRDRHSHGHLPCVVRRCTDMDGFPTNQFQRLFHAHRKIGQRLIHVEDEMPVVMTAKEEGMNEAHVVACLRLNFLGLALAYVRAHLIDKQLSMH